MKDCQEEPCLILNSEPTIICHKKKIQVRTKYFCSIKLNYCLGLGCQILDGYIESRLPISY